MQFSIKEWRRMYDKVQYLGQILKDSHPSVDENKLWRPALHAISEEAQKSLEQELKELLTNVSQYLDSCGMKLLEASWDYDKDDPTTWESHRSFKFKHLLNKRRYKCRNGYQLSHQLG